MNPLIYSGIQESLTRYAQDVSLDGYSVDLVVGTFATPAELRAFLLAKNEAGVQGCLLVGDFPVAWYRTNYSDWGPEQFPIDLYYMDLDGAWEDGNGDGLFESHSAGSGDVGPEMYVGRLTASTLTTGGATEVGLLNEYFVKNHSYRAAGSSVPARALAYIDDDWSSSSYFTSSEIGLEAAYPGAITYVTDGNETKADDYLQRLTSGYQYVLLACHGSSYGCSFKLPPGQWTGGHVSSADVIAADPPVEFFNLFVCSGARYVESNYFAGWHVFDASHGLAAVGSTKTGSMYHFHDFNAPLAAGETIGQAFESWFTARASSGFGAADEAWFYGMTLLGDPLLTLTPAVSDTTPPTTTASGADDAWHSTPVTVRFTASDAGPNASGVDYTEYKLDDGSWTRGTSVEVSAPPATKTTHVICYRSRDLAGNLEADKSCQVMIDTTVPPSTLTLNGTFLPDHAVHLHPAIMVGDTLWCAQGTLDFAAGRTPTAEALVYALDGGGWSGIPMAGFQIAIGAGPHEIDYMGIDGEGTALEATQTLRFNVDGTPAGLNVSGQEPGWHSSYVLGLTWTDAETGIRPGEVQEVKVYKDGSAEPSTWQTWDAATIDAAYLQGQGISPFEGELMVVVRGITNGVGLPSAKRSVALQMDALPPRTADSADGAWHGSPLQLTLLPSDAGAGVHETQYRVDDGSWQTGTSVGLAEGVHNVDYFSTDNAANVEATKTCEVKIDGSSPTTVQTGADDAWHLSPVTVSFAASDVTSGVQKTEYRLDAGDWTTGTQVTVTTDGDHALRYRSHDNAGNVEEAETCWVRIDKTPPVTAQTGADVRWHNLAVTVAFAAWDRTSGVASTSFSTDGGLSWQSGACVIEAPATHANDGAHAILYRSADNAGLVEASRSATVRIDTRQPLTAAPYPSKVRRGYWATLRYRVDDQQPCASKANVTIKVATLGGKVVKVLKLGQGSVNRLLSYQFRCRLAKRTYKFRVYATDAAGNKQAVAGWNRLIVK